MEFFMENVLKSPSSDTSYKWTKGFNQVIHLTAGCAFPLQVIPSVAGD